MVAPDGRPLFPVIIQEVEDEPVERPKRPLHITTWLGEPLQDCRRDYLCINFNARIVQPDGTVKRRIWVIDRVDGFPARAWGWVTVEADSHFALPTTRHYYILRVCVEPDKAGPGATYHRLWLRSRPYDIEQAN